MTRHWAALVITLGLTVLPSLYAWMNILASWDPYGHTASLPVAVVNEDRGATVDGKPVRVGDEVVSSLRANRQIGWVFVDAKTAARGVEDGTYYASLLIPSAFSETLTSILTHHPTPATIDYTVNEKISAVAPRITSAGANAVVERINQAFVEVADGAIFQVFNRLGYHLLALRPNLESFTAWMDAVDQASPDIARAVAGADAGLQAFSALLDALPADLPQVTKALQDATQATSATRQVLRQVADRAPEAESAIRRAAAWEDSVSGSLSARWTGVANAARPAPASAGAAAPGANGPTDAEVAAEMSTVANSIADALDAYNQLSGGRLETSLKAARDLERSAAALNRAVRSAPPGTVPDSATRAAATAARDGVHRATADLLADPGLGAGIAQAFQAADADLARVQSTLQAVESALPSATAEAGLARRQVGQASAALHALHQQLPALQAQLHAADAQLHRLQQTGDLDRLMQLLTIPAGAAGSFLSQPVTLRPHRLFPIPNYGSAMSPFFTTLSLWVGGLLMVSLLSAEPSDAHRWPSHIAYLGRFLTFWVISLLQALCVSLGDIFLLGAYVAAPGWFVLFSLLLGSVFTFIIYTLVFVFGNLGKALAIILLVLQLAGAGGTFPIELAPHALKVVHPYLPFTYAIGLMREAVGGPIWRVIGEDLRIMLVYVFTTLLLGVLLKPRLGPLTERFVRSARSSGLIH
ncbi:YhgE/Pip domain-containing protein [Alicyclobacillus sp.]|uniref:YhgE/Pip domain-containing protein n=1 Tax=Alicyclobacillus sp. TaxID=61169 RepID=UPI0025BCE0D2|nr:YhgE/Pip domain-containing protein [Alicyclobacillus sp.]